MDDPAAIRVKLIPCHTLKGYFSCMTDGREELGHCSCLSITQRFPQAFQYAIDINQTSDHMCLRDMFSLALSYIKCLSTLENEKEAL